MQPAASPIQSATSGAGQSAPGGQRERFAADELAIVLSHYNLGVIESIAEFNRGSRRAPKLLITSESGRYLLKRRARGKDDLNKVRLTHALQRYLAAQQFPLPRLIGTAFDDDSMVVWRSGVYELFEYINGQPYPHSLEATYEAGRVLALYHELLTEFRLDPPSSMGSYHNQGMVDQGLAAIPSSVPPEEGLDSLLQALGETFHCAAEKVEALGFSQWPKQYVHGDWHPGNMLFRDNRVVAVIDYDSARQLQRITDVANGSLQFSIIGGDQDPSQWPDHVDESRLKRFIRGYDGVSILSRAEIQALPWLMAEALIAEAVLPIAITGSFGRIGGTGFLRMVQRKTQWITRSADALISLVGG
jgi:Ser/Thr protein kinase RdoA (MazF antagonist)